MLTCFILDLSFDSEYSTVVYTVQFRFLVGDNETACIVYDRDEWNTHQYFFWTMHNCFSGLSTKSLRKAALARNKRDLVAATEMPASLAISLTDLSFD